MIAVHLDIMLAVFLTFRNLWISPLLMMINSLIAVALILVYLRFFWVIFKKGNKLEKKIKFIQDTYANKESRAAMKYKTMLEKMDYGFLKEDRNFKAQYWGGICDQLFMVKDFLTALVIVSFVEYPILQLLPCIFLCGSAIFLVIKFKPYNSKLMTLVAIVNEVVYLLIFTFFILFFSTAKSMADSTKYLYFGFIPIVIIVLSIVFNLAIAGYLAYLGIYEACKEKEDEHVRKPRSRPNTLKSGSSLKNGLKKRKKKKKTAQLVQVQKQGSSRGSNQIRMQNRVN